MTSPPDRSWSFYIVVIVLLIEWPTFCMQLAELFNATFRLEHLYTHTLNILSTEYIKFLLFPNITYNDHCTKAVFVLIFVTFLSHLP